MRIFSINTRLRCLSVPCYFIVSADRSISINPTIVRKEYMPLLPHLLPSLSYRDRIPELSILEGLISSLKHHARVEILDTVRHGKLSFPLYSIVLGSTKPDAPSIGFFGGVHGLERIGSQVVLAYLETLAAELEWDEVLQRQLTEMRMVFMPIVNPVGMYLQRRSNGNHVDLMRNSPVNAEDATFMVGGQRISPILPWFRGAESGQMEQESDALCKLVEKEQFKSKTAISLDVHSGFGVIDRLWFPYAKSKRPYPDLAEAHAFKSLLDHTLPNHVYHYEPQADNYVTHGDLWDFLYDKNKAQGLQNSYLPLTLEIGSWLWLRKNPIQIFSFLGPFNPVKPHRKRRTLRRHLPFFDFVSRSVRSSQSWAHMTEADRELNRKQGLNLWYKGLTK